MEDKIIIIKSINYRGGNTIVRWIETCKCGCREKSFLYYWPSNHKLAESTILTKIKELNPEEENKEATNED